ncbi:ribonuclease HII [Candidatus Peregrinibacteria bacterium]|nr:ribonuclease HII [Candidatus Peregrinibacteria bacterium]
MSPFLPLESTLRKLGYNFIAGIDEAGRGPLAGPVVSAAVILRKNAKIPGIKDSKLLTPNKRKELFDLIVKNSVDFAITAVSHKIIDEINILNSVRFANYLCINYLKHKPDIALIDGIDKQELQIPFKNIIKGDVKIRSIAAASILAKVVRDTIMITYSKEYKDYCFEKNVGYCTREHVSLLKKYGPCDIHRKSYNIKTFTYTNS